MNMPTSSVVGCCNVCFSARLLMGPSVRPVMLTFALCVARVASVLVDHWLPCKDPSKLKGKEKGLDHLPAFAKTSSSNKTWPCIVEKVCEGCTCAPTKNQALPVWQFVLHSCGLGWCVPRCVPDSVFSGQTFCVSIFLVVLSASEAAEIMPH